MPKTEDLLPCAMSIMSAATADAVGPDPAPGPI